MDGMDIYKEREFAKLTTLLDRAKRAGAGDVFSFFTNGNVGMTKLRLFVENLEAARG